MIKQTGFAVHAVGPVCFLRQSSQDYLYVPILLRALSSELYL